MSDDLVGMKRDGAILLGKHVSCDGFSSGHAFRVQTHVHADHMNGFDTSKANQTLLMSEATRDLLIAMFNADLPYRSNLEAISSDGRRKVGTDTVELVPSNHMLGSTQVLVKIDGGRRLGYSSDFFWPVEDVIEVDELVVDSTYGDRTRVRKFTQADVDDVIVRELVARQSRGQSAALIGHNGRLQHALHLLVGIATCPIVCSPRSYPLVQVYENHGYSMPPVVSSASPEGIEILKSRQLCIACITMTERRHHPWVDRFCKISLSAFMSSQSEPFLDYGNGDCCIAFTDHADYEGTLKYVEASGARIVWTDPRGGDAEALSRSIRDELGVNSMPLSPDSSLGWG